MSIIGTLLGTAAEKAENKRLWAEAKIGKSESQCQAIKFFADEVGGAGCGCMNRETPMSINEYQESVADFCNGLNVKAKAMLKIGLDESQISEIPPICLSSYVFDDDVYVRVENNIAVSSQYCVSWLFFSATQMYTYSYIFDMTSDNTWETTNDFFYQDITCFTTESKIVEKIVKDNNYGCLFNKESCFKCNYVVDTLKIVVPGTSYEVSMRNAGTQTESIQAAKNMLRERKFIK